MVKLVFTLVSTNHLEGRLWFRDDDDFKVGMNDVAILSAILNIKVVAFILMSNHVHFILEGTRENALMFIT